MKIYFAGSIRGGRVDKQLYLQIIRKLQKFGDVLTEHVGDQNDVPLIDKNVEPEVIFRRDLNWLESADTVIAEVTTPSLGVGWEVARAEEAKKAILCIHRAEKEKLSATIQGNPNLKVVRYDSVDDLNKVFTAFFAALKK